MLIVSKDQIYIKTKDIPRNILNQLKRELTFDNPKFLEAEKFGYQTRDIEEKISLYNFIQDNSDIYFCLPRGYGMRLIEVLRRNNIKYSFKDARIELEEIDFGSKIKLRDYQSPAVEALVERGQGGVVAGCGSGKTQILLEAMARLKQPALWICHTYDLLVQTKERAAAFLDLQEDEIGTIADGKIELGDKLTIGLVQTLSKRDLSKIADKFGTVLIDEAHHIPANSFFNVINKLPAKYRLWASATPRRGDGLTEMIYLGGGEITYTIGREELPTVTPSVYAVKTDFRSDEEHYARLISDMINNSRRNDLIIDVLSEEAPGNSNLVISDRRDHLFLLKEMLDEQTNLKSEILIGGSNKKEREEAISKMRNKEIDILLATKVAREGLDIENLNRLFLVTPKSSRSVVEQEVGRIMRPCEDKEDVIVFDFWDTQVGIPNSQFWKRWKTYQKLGVKRFHDYQIKNVS